MKKKELLLIWNALVIAVSLAVILPSIMSHFFSSLVLSPYIISAAVLIITLILLFLLRNHIERTAKFLFSYLLGAGAGVASGGLFLLTDFSHSFEENLPLAVIIVTLTVFILFVFFTWRKLLVSIIVFLVIIIVMFIAVQLNNSKHLKFLESHLALWKQKGWAVDEKEVFPKKPTRSLCEDWFDKMRLSVNENIDKSVQLNIIELNSGIRDALSKGIEPKEMIDNNQFNKNQQWQSFLDSRPVIIEAMNKCPHIQWFDPAHYKENPRDVPVPDLVSLLKWSQATNASAMIIASNGQAENAKVLCEEMHIAAMKFYIPGQVLINNLISMAVDRDSAYCFAGIQQMTKTPWPTEFREKLKSYAKIDSTWINSIFDENRWSIYTLYKNYGLYESTHWTHGYRFYKYEILTDDMLLILTILSRWKAYHNALLWYDSENTLNILTIMNEWLRTVPDYEKNKYAWHDLYAKRTRLSDMHAAYTEYNQTTALVSVYARLLRKSTVWNLLLAMDDVYLYYQENDKLPDNAEMLHNPFPIDAFTDLPLRYVKNDETHFIVYSIGPDEIDQKGEFIFLPGILFLDKHYDIGYHVSVKSR